MFIPWVSNDISKNLDTKKRICNWTENEYNSIMNDERIKELLRTNSFYVESHNYGDIPTLEKMMGKSLNNTIGRITNILFDGIEFEKLDTEFSNRMFEEIDASLLRAQRLFLYNIRRTRIIKLIKINIGYMEDSNFIMI